MVVARAVAVVPVVRRFGAWPFVAPLPLLAVVFNSRASSSCTAWRQATKAFFTFWWKPSRSLSSRSCPASKLTLQVAPTEP